MGLPRARQKIVIELVNARHQSIEQASAQVTIPTAKPRPDTHEAIGES